MRKRQLHESTKLADLVGELGIVNRRALDNRLARTAERLSKSDQNKEAPPSAEKGLLIVMADLDGLKMINEASPDPGAGHVVGDAALCKVAMTLLKCVRPVDLVARVGGDEFVAIIESNSQAEAQKILAIDPSSQAESGLIERLRAGMERERQNLKQEYGAAWPADDDFKKPGQISVGWSFVSELGLTELYERYQEMPKEHNNGRKHDFLSLVFKEADSMMMIEKQGKKL